MARARFNVRFNDNYTQESLRALLELRAQNTARSHIRWHIEWEPSNADAFLAPPGPFIDLVSGAIANVTGRTPDALDHRAAPPTRASSRTTAR